MVNILINGNVSNCNGNPYFVGKPLDWSTYVGSGAIIDWGSSNTEYTSPLCSAYITGQSVDYTTFSNLNISLIAGNSNGYTGPNAYNVIAGNTYYLEFQIKHNFDQIIIPPRILYIMPRITYWTSINALQSERKTYNLKLPSDANFYIPNTNGLWVKYSTTFIMPSDAVKAVLGFNIYANYPLGEIKNGTCYIDDVILDDNVVCPPIVCNLNVL